MTVKTRAIANLCVILAFASGEAYAGFAGHNTKGDFGLQSGTQPPPGFLIAPMYYRYSGNTLKDSRGDKISIDPDDRGSLDANAYVLSFIWVSDDLKILGGNYSFQAFPALSDNTLEVPVLGLEEIDLFSTVSLFEALSFEIHYIVFKTRVTTYLHKVDSYISRTLKSYRSRRQDP